MRSIGRFLTALALTIILLFGAAGGASAHDLMADHRTVHHGDPCSGHNGHGAPPSEHPDQDHNPNLSIAAPCCPSLGTPARLEVARVLLGRRATWHPHVEPSLATLLTAPEPPPPRFAL